MTALLTDTDADGRADRRTVFLTGFGHSDKRIERLNSSVMPEGLVSALSRDEIRDLFAYLKSLK